MDWACDGPAGLFSRPPSFFSSLLPQVWKIVNIYDQLRYQAKELSKWTFICNLRTLTRLKTDGWKERNQQTKVGIVLPVRTHFVLNSSVLARVLLGVDAAEMTNYSFLLLSFLSLVPQTETSCSHSDGDTWEAEACVLISCMSPSVFHVKDHVSPGCCFYEPSPKTLTWSKASSLVPPFFSFFSCPGCF